MASSHAIDNNRTQWEYGLLNLGVLIDVGGCHTSFLNHNGLGCHCANRPVEGA